MKKDKRFRFAVVEKNGSYFNLIIMLTRNKQILHVCCISPAPTLCALVCAPASLRSFVSLQPQLALRRKRKKPVGFSTRWYERIVAARADSDIQRATVW
uniref:Uncharacterized protein n=1 Tax=Anopheles dirus TaxID=7168 RepID=A0A182NW50_9DIPT